MIENGTIDDTSTGIRAGEPGKNVAGPALDVHDVGITGEAIADFDNVTQSTISVIGSGSADTYTTAASSTGVISFHGGAGDDSFTGSSASTALRNPTITARISSAEPRSASGWFRTPVTVTFTCTPGDAPLAGPCPAPVTLRQEGAGQSITRTVVATDGGAATVAVSPINIDRTGPRVRVRGVRGATSGRPPRGVCAAQDALSGVASCTITRSIHPRRVVYVAVATDEAGNTATDRVVVRRRR